jgi:hypothetical protein
VADVGVNLLSGDDEGASGADATVDADRLGCRLWGCVIALSSR